MLASPIWHNRFALQTPLGKEPMLRYFVSELEVRVELIRPLVPADQQTAAVLATVTKGLAALAKSADTPDWGIDQAWIEAYRLERLLAVIEPDATLLREVARRVDEAFDQRVPSAERLRTAFLDLKRTIPSEPPPWQNGEAKQLRSMLLDVLEETHWALQRKFYSRPIQKSATRRLVVSGIAAFTLFILPYAWIYLHTWWSDNGPPPVMAWSGLPLWTAATAGAFGAMFSRLIYLQYNWDNLSLGALKDAREFASVLLRAAVGMTGAVVVYFFLQSGAVQGSLFPKFNELGLEQLYYAKASPDGSATVPLRLILPNVNLALLVVWSFLAGFSERLVPSVLQKTETSLNSAAAKAA